MHAILSISVLTLSFLTYHFLTQSQSLKGVFISEWGDERTKIYWIYFQRLLGFGLYGLIPLVIVLVSKLEISSLGVISNLSKEVVIWSVGLSIVVILMNFFATKSRDNLAMYPQIRSKNWPNSLIVKSGLTWVAYLIAYEFLFRGYLLFSWEWEAGAALAIAVNIALYALVHVPKGIKEAFGAIPLGIVLCLLTLKTGSIWIAIIVHVAMALSNEWFSIYYQKRMG